MQYTIRGVVDHAIRERARAAGKSLNEAVVDALAEGAGVAGTPRKRRDLGDIAGTWKADKAPGGCRGHRVALRRARRATGLSRLRRSSTDRWSVPCHSVTRLSRPLQPHSPALAPSTYRLSSCPPPGAPVTALDPEFGPPRGPNRFRRRTRLNSLSSWSTLPSARPMPRSRSWTRQRRSPR